MKKISTILLGIVVFGLLFKGFSVFAATTPSKKAVSISVKDAISIFQSEYPNTDITSLELDNFFGRYFYEIEGMDDTSEYTLKIDAKNKKFQIKKRIIWI